MINGRDIAASIANLGVAVVLGVTSAWADHRCDPVSDAGWRIVVDHETVGQVDGAPYRDGSGNWFIDRTVTLLPFCHYFDEIGNYSLRSYSLSPTITKQRVGICRGAVAVPPYAGRCPPQ